MLPFAVHPSIFLLTIIHLFLHHSIIFSLSIYSFPSSFGQSLLPIFNPSFHHLSPPFSPSISESLYLSVHLPSLNDSTHGAVGKVSAWRSQRRTSLPNAHAHTSTTSTAAPGQLPLIRRPSGRVRAAAANCRHLSPKSLPPSSLHPPSREDQWTPVIGECLRLLLTAAQLRPFFPPLCFSCHILAVSDLCQRNGSVLKSSPPNADLSHCFSAGIQTQTGASGVMTGLKLSSFPTKKTSHRVSTQTAFAPSFFFSFLRSGK